MIAQAQSGTGKTGAFTISVLEKIILFQIEEIPYFKWILTFL